MICVVYMNCTCCNIYCIHSCVFVYITSIIQILVVDTVCSRKNLSIKQFVDKRRLVGINLVNSVKESPFDKPHVGFYPDCITPKPDINL